jgi:cap2 methyltransferase
VFKPATSKAGNSEQYIICLGYKGRSNVLTHGHLERFRAVYGKRTPPFPFLPLSAIPESFLTQLINCATKFARHQVDLLYNYVVSFPGSLIFSVCNIEILGMGHGNETIIIEVTDGHMT